VEYPTDRHYTKEHEWVLQEGRTALVGITDFAQKELGDIVYVELPETGQRVQAGDVLGTVESVKAVSEIFAPLAGTVVEANAILDERPEMLNEDPHGAGWYCKLQLVSASDLDGLMEAADYVKLTEA